MSGNSRSGRPPQPLESHALRGTWKKTRHGPKLAASRLADPPADTMTMYVPDGFSKSAEEMWSMLEKQLGDVLKETDSAEFSMLCEMWGLYLGALKAARKNPTGKNERTAVLAYSTQFDRLASRFGLTPADRARLRAVLPTQRANDKFDLLLERKNAPRIATRNRG